MGGIRWWMFLAVLTLLCKNLEGCSCMREHPQAQYCSADFAIVATVRKLVKIPRTNENMYRLKIRKEFKTSDKAKVALKAGRLFTARDDGMCGVSLNLNQTYLITGRIESLRAHVNLCNYVELWKHVTPRQRKGFRMLYKQGCPCKILPCHTNLSCSKPSKSICRWADPYSPDSCHVDHGICLINNNGMCHWAKAPRLSMCLKKKHFKMQDPYFH